MKPAAQATAGAGLALLVALPPLRAPLEAHMALHMLVQLPALVVAGALLAAATPAALGRALDACNAHGLAGWLFASLATAAWMLPRALDEAVADPSVALAKFASLLLAGAALRRSWRESGVVVQLFFVGNAAWMWATVGLLYQTADARLCNAYLVGDQVIAGQGLVAQAVIVATAWALSAWRRFPGLAGDTRRS